jgi:hypothetical protein
MSPTSAGERHDLACERDRRLPAWAGGARATVTAATRERNIGTRRCNIRTTDRNNETWVTGEVVKRRTGRRAVAGAWRSDAARTRQTADAVTAGAEPQPETTSAWVAVTPLNAAVTRSSTNLRPAGDAQGMQAGSRHTSKIFLAAPRDVATIGADGRVAGDPESPRQIVRSSHTDTRTSYDMLARDRLSRGMQGQRASAIDHRCAIGREL